MGATQGIDAALKAYNLDALILPAPGYTTVPAGAYSFYSSRSLVIQPIHWQLSLDIPS